MKSSTELLRAYSIIIQEAENPDFDNRDSEGQDDFEQENDFQPEQDIEDNDPVAELAHELHNGWADSDEEYEEMIRNFLKSHNYTIVPINGLENTSGSV